MKQTLLIALLGATVSLAAPSLSYADNGHKFKSNALSKHELLLKKKQQQRHNRHKSKSQKFVAKKTVKNNKRVVKNTHRHINKHNTTHYKKKTHTPKFVAKKPPKNNKRIVKNTHKNNYKHNLVKHNVAKHNAVKHHAVKPINHVKKHYVKKHNSKPSFSISWNNGSSTISYGNDSFRHDKQYNQRHHFRQRELRKIYNRMSNQTNLINHGIKSGQLVDREVSKLRYEQRHIKNTMKHYKHDGRINRYERAKLHKLLDVAKQNIHLKRNNHRTRYTQQQRRNHQHNSHNYNSNYYVQF